MRRTIIIVVLLSVVLAAPFLSARDKPLFGKGVAYLLIGDKDLARKHWDLFFEDYPDPALRGPFMDLIEAVDLWEVAKEFKRYLDLHHRSTTALVGIALATTDMKQSTSIDNLNRAVRMDRSYSSAYLCLGMEYFKQRNYPRAKSYFNRALMSLKVPEYKILLAKLYFRLNQPADALNLLKPEADRHPDNFYFNYLTAEAYLHLNQLDAMDRYMHTALEVAPANMEAQLLKARYFLGRDETKQAQAILKTLKFKDYNEDYYKTYARVLLKLKDGKCKSYLDQVYFTDRWDRDINRLMGLYYKWKKQENGNVQNWINRSLLCGNSVEQLKQLFPGKYQFPDYPYLSFFDMTVIRWLSDEMLVVGAKRRSGEEEKLFFVRIDDLKIMNIVVYKGDLQDIFISKDGKKIIFATTALENRSVYVYAIELFNSTPRLSLVSSRPLPLSAVDVGFNYTGTLAYITDKRLSKLAFESPFSIVSEIGEKTPVYPSYPYPIYKFNFVTKKLTAIDINDVKLVGKVPIESVKKYYMIYEAHQSKNTIQNLIEKGKKLDITSSALVKIYFSHDSSSFIIYLSDLKNAFQALIYEYFSNRLFRIDETMFIGTGNYAELELLDFDPQNKEVLVLTKDEERRLIKFNYKSFLALELADKVVESYYDRNQDMFYILSERSKKSLFTETNLEIVYMKPFFREMVGEHRDLNQVLFTRGDDRVYFTTFNGELLMMDGEHKFHYVGPSAEDSLHAISTSGNKQAAFINERLYILDSLYKPPITKEKTN
ncbi:MAG: tetratricopeptide repeat protein [Candidatus Aminicenantes bacterium]|jgi:tetratricopeptide (TPR) repeat protein